MTKKRKKKDKQKKYRIYIVCEGTNTEPNYFKEIAEKPEVFEGFAITIYPSEEETNKGLDKQGESIKTDAKNLVKIASFENAQKLEKGEKVVNIAFSSIAIEHWILLHYEQNKRAFDKSKNVIEYLKDEEYLLDDLKDPDTLIYSQLKEKTETAIQNAAWLRMEMETELEANDDKIYELNPYVTVDELVRKLLNFPRVTYGKINEIVEIDYLSIKVQSLERKDNAITIELTVINRQKIGYLINNSNQEFVVTNEDGERFPMSIATSELIDPNTEKNITLNFSISKSKGNLRFNFIRGDRQIIIDL